MLTRGNIWGFTSYVRVISIMFSEIRKTEAVLPKADHVVAFVYSSIWWTNLAYALQISQRWEIEIVVRSIIPL